MRTMHDYDCSIYECMVGGSPEAGICTCGYGVAYKLENDGNIREMYSDEQLQSIMLLDYY